ncbi:MAG: sigma-54-dependent Fis family transcriptional regulator [Planctomycetaceae bacterium]|nr:sigma-54-dependent Fis family transcriptional regulator [Planctomycetaceae bacterium]
MSSSSPLNLLLVEDDDGFRETAAAWLKRMGHHVEQAGNGQEALKILERAQFDVAIVDMNMPGISGLELLQQIGEKHYEIEVLILTGQATVENAVAAMKHGACDYLTKPFPLAELERRAQMAATNHRLKRENAHLLELLSRERRPVKIIGESAPMDEVFRLIERAAPTDKAVLIEGESGTGKELVARAIQERSLRAQKPFVTINCAALPETLVESELFGHEKGAFTGATARKNGLFEVADGGTLFVDEIGELPLALQPKLLRVLEDGSLRRVGSHQERRVNVRVIAATNRDLSKEVEASRFREDLYYRINVVSVRLPPLRERPGDIPLLLKNFVGSEWTIDPDAREKMEHYHWPGNVRQLINAVDRAMILADDKLITIDDLPREISDQPVTNRRTVAEIPVAPGDDLASLERNHIIAVLKRENGNKAKAARTLGIHRRKLYRLIERLKIDPDSLD